MSPPITHRHTQHHDAPVRIIDDTPGWSAISTYTPEPTVPYPAEVCEPAPPADVHSPQRHVRVSTNSNWLVEVYKGERWCRVVAHPSVLIDCSTVAEV
jgi:hypothetical protein